MLRRLHLYVLLVGCTAVLIACQGPLPTPPPIEPSPSPRSDVQPPPVPTLTHTAIPSRVTTRLPQATLAPLPSSTLAATALPPTIPAPQLTTLAQITTSQLAPAAPPVTPRALTFTVASAQSAWTVWHAVSLPNAVLALATQSDRVWVGTQYGIWQIRPDAHHLEKYPMPRGAVSLLLPIEDGQVWASINADLFFFDGQQWQKMTSLNPNILRGWSTYGAFNLLAIDTTGNLRLEAWGSRGDLAPLHYAGHVPGPGALERDVDSFLYRAQTNCEQLTMLASTHNQSYRSRAECLAFQAALQIVPLPARGMRLAFDADNSLWGVNLDNGEINHWSNGRLAVIKLPLGTRPYAVTADPDQGIWIGTDRGLMYTAGQVIYQLPNLDRRFTGGNPIDLAVEPSGAAWALTAESKLSWLPADRSSGDFKVIAGVSARAIAATSDGIWITHGDDLIHLKLGDRIPASIPSPDANCRLKQLTSAPNGDVWATSRCGSAWQYQPATGQWTRHVLDTSTAELAKFDPIEAVIAATDGRVYAIGPSGFAPLTESNGISVGTPQILDDALPYRTYRYRVQSVADGVAPLSNGSSAADRHGGFWLTTTNRGNLWHYANGQFTALEQPFSSTWLTTVHVDQSNRLWAASLYQQLAVYDGQDWRTFPTLGIGTVYRIADAPNGQLWFVGSQGVALYDPAQDLRP